MTGANTRCASCNSLLPDEFSSDDLVERKPCPVCRSQASAERRNKIVHKGVIVTQAEAEISYDAACKFVSYLKQ